MLILFFNLTYAPAGAMFNIYTPNLVNATSITMISNIAVSNLDNKALLDTINEDKIKND